MAKKAVTTPLKNSLASQNTVLYWIIASLFSIILTTILYRNPTDSTPLYSVILGYGIFIFISSILVTGLMSIKDKDKLKVNFVAFLSASSIAVLSFTLSIFAMTFFIYSRVIRHELCIIGMLSLVSIFILIYTFICINHKIRGIEFNPRQDSKKILIITIIITLLILIASSIIINKQISIQLENIDKGRSSMNNEYVSLIEQIENLPENYYRIGYDIRIFIERKKSEEGRIHDNINAYCNRLYKSDICYEQIQSYIYVSVENTIRMHHAKLFLTLIQNNTIDNPSIIIENYKNSILFQKQYPEPYTRGRYSDVDVLFNPIFITEGIPNNVDELKMYLFFRTNKGQITRDTVIDILEYTNYEAKSFSILPVILPQNILELDEPQESKAMRIKLVEEFTMRR